MVASAREGAYTVVAGRVGRARGLVALVDVVTNHAVPSETRVAAACVGTIRVVASGLGVAAVHAIALINIIADDTVAGKTSVACA